MAIRCLLDDHDRCTNGNVRGVAFKDLMDPVNNIEPARASSRTGATAAASWRRRSSSATPWASPPGERMVPCQHKTHGWWAHYNHGPRYIEKGYARHYPHRVAVLDHAFATVMNTPAPELTAGRITIHDPGKRERTADRPLEPRYKKLYSQILSGGTCSAIALNCSPPRRARRGAAGPGRSAAAAPETRGRMALVGAGVTAKRRSRPRRASMTPAGRAPAAAAPRSPDQCSGA